jgi:hypothetical protein
VQSNEKAAKAMKDADIIYMSAAKGKRPNGFCLAASWRRNFCCELESDIIEGRTSPWEVFRSLDRGSPVFAEGERVSHQFGVRSASQYISVERHRAKNLNRDFPNKIGGPQRFARTFKPLSSPLFFPPKQQSASKWGGCSSSHRFRQVFPRIQSAK